MLGDPSLRGFEGEAFGGGVGEHGVWDLDFEVVVADWVVAYFVNLSG